MKALRARCKPKSALPGIAVALCLALTGLAEAEPREVGYVGGALLGPKLVGDEVAWMDEECPDCFIGGIPGAFGIFAADRSGDEPPRRLARGFIEGSLGGSVSVFEEVDFDVSQSSLAIRRQQTVSSCCDVNESTFLRFGARGERLPAVVRCHRRGVPYSVDGDRLLFLDGCDAETRTLTLLDRRTSQRRTVAVGSSGAGSISDVALAGGFAAVYGPRGPETGAEIVVVRLDGGGGEYRVPLPPGVESDQIDLDARGRLAVLARKPGSDGRNCQATELSWYSPAEPFAHALPVEPCLQQVAWAGERIAYAGGPSVGGFGTQLRTVGLGSGERLAVDAGRVRLFSFDADPRHLAYGLTACGGGIDLLVLPLIDRASPRPASCPTRLASRRIPVRERRAHVKLACPRGCSGTVRILRGGRRLSRDPLFGQPRPRGTHAVRVPGPILRLVRARGQVVARVRIRSRDRTLQRKVTERTRRVTLVRPSRRR